MSDHPLLDHLVGHWVLRGTVAGQSQPVTHDVDADWVIDRYYVRIHEISRERNKDGKPEYEAMVFVAWNKDGHYSCVWLDVFGGLSTLSIGVAAPKENELRFLFIEATGKPDLTNTFRYDPKDDSWVMLIDNIVNGVPKEFARLRLTRS